MDERSKKKLGRRSMLKCAGVGLLGGLFANMISPLKSHAAPLAHAMWVHGHSMQIEYPANIASIWRAGFYVRIEGKPKTQNWFHFAIPTPVIVNGQRLKAQSVMLLCRTGSKDAIVRDVHIYDGDKKISENKDKNLTENIGFRRFKIDKEHEVKWGIGISIGVSFTGGKGSKRMEFISAGCDFSL